MVLHEENKSMADEFVMKFCLHDNKCDIKPETNSHSNTDIEFLKCILSENEKFLFQYVEKILLDYNYHGSPTLEKYIDKESYAQIVDKVMKKASENDKINQIISDAEIGKWNKKELLKSLISMLILIIIIR